MPGQSPYPHRLEAIGGVIILAFGLAWSLLSAGPSYMAAIFALGLAAFLIRLGVKSRRLENAKTWPVAEGTIEGAEVRTKYGGEAWITGVQLSYTYSALGRRHSGSFFQRCFFRKDAERLAQTFSPHGAVRLRYDPRRPEHTILESELQAGALSISSALLLALGTAVGLLLLFAALFVAFL